MRCTGGSAKKICYALRYQQREFFLLCAASGRALRFFVTRCAEGSAMAFSYALYGGQRERFSITRCTKTFCYALHRGQR